MKKFLFVDLDDTLFQTPKKCRSETDLRPAAYLKDGSVCSFTTARQRAFLAFAQRDMTLIPATARNADAFKRVNIPDVAFTSFAIIDYGGVVLLSDGKPDPVWQESMREAMHLALPGLQGVCAHIDAYLAMVGWGGKARLIEDFATPFYVVLKDPEAKSERLAQVEEELLLPWLEQMQGQYTLHRNGNNLAILPQALNKARAVAHVSQRLAEEHGDIIRFGMGDSRSDARFMAACDYAIIPTGSQLAALTVEAL